MRRIERSCSSFSTSGPRRFLRPMLSVAPDSQGDSLQKSLQTPPSPSTAGLPPSGARRFERPFNRRHRQEEFVGMIFHWPKFMVKIELYRTLVQGLDNNADRRHLRCVPPTPIQRIHQEKSPEALPTARTADRQPAEQSCGQKRVPGKFLGNDLWQFAQPDGIGRQGVVAGNRPFLVH